MTFRTLIAVLAAGAALTFAAAPASAALNVNGIALNGTASNALNVNGIALNGAEAAVVAQPAALGIVLPSGETISR